jgi:hypothetical protein
MSDIQKKLKNIITKVKEKTHHVFNEEQVTSTEKKEPAVVKRIVARRHSSYVKTPEFSYHTYKQPGKTKGYIITYINMLFRHCFNLSFL